MSAIIEKVVGLMIEGIPERMSQIPGIPEEKKELVHKVLVRTLHDLKKTMYEMLNDPPEGLTPGTPETATLICMGVVRSFNKQSFSDLILHSINVEVEKITVH